MKAKSGGEAASRDIVTQIKFARHRSRQEVSPCGDLNASLMFRRVYGDQRFRRWTASGEAAGGRFIYFFLNTGELEIG